MQLGHVIIAETDGVVGITCEGFRFGLKCGEVAFRERDETLSFVFDIIFEEEIVLLREELGGWRRGEAGGEVGWNAVPQSNSDR